MATACLQRGVIKIPMVRSEYSWRTKSMASSVSPSKEPPQLTEEDLAKLQAARVIERWWVRMRNRNIFKMLKEAICTAEHSLTREILRKVSPVEAGLLQDPALQARVKFRFAGSEFPPNILFKIYTSTGSGGVQYISGRRMIRPASEAAEDARRQMGNRKFYDQMLMDACQHHQLKITDEVDVTTMKEYMQYVSNIDETPAYMGGRENSWRKLNLDVLPRHSYMYNLVEFLDQAQLPGGMSLDRLARPPTQFEQIKHIKAVSSMSSPRASPLRPPPFHESRVPSRRSRQAQQRVEKMKKAYGMREEDGIRERPDSKDSETSDTMSCESPRARDEADVVDDENWEEEACELYRWSQELSFEDIR